MTSLINNHLKTGYSDYNIFFLRNYYQELNLSNKILDVGCGHYRNLYLFYQVGFKELHGIDRDLPHPSEKPKRFKVNFIQNNIIKGLPYIEKEFDIVLCNYVLMFIPKESLSFVLRELLRITKVFCIIETNKPFYKANNTQFEEYSFKDIVQFIQNNNEFEIINKKMYKEKLIITRKINARGRKSEKIKVITGRDKDLIKQLSRTGICTASQAKQYAGVSYDRLKKLEKSGYVKTSNHTIRGENNRIIQIDKGGIEYIRQELGIHNRCITQTNHLEHDIKLTEFYYRLEPNVQDTWRHEADLIRDYHEKFPHDELKTCVDSTIQINGEVIAIESVGDSYTNKLMELKQEISQKLGCTRLESF